MYSDVTGTKGKLQAILAWISSYPLGSQGANKTSLFSRHVLQTSHVSYTENCIKNDCRGCYGWGYLSVLWLTQIFHCIYSSRSIRPKKCSGERPRLCNTGGALTQISLRCQQSLNHSVAVNFTVGSLVGCCRRRQSEKSLCVCYYAFSFTSHLDRGVL